MGETKDAAESQVDDKQPAQAATTESDEKPQAGTEQSQADSTEEATSQSDSELARARAEAAKYRTQLRKFEKAEEERKKAEMTEAEKLKADRETFEKERQALAQSQRDFTAKQQVISEAGKAGFKVSPERVFALLKGEIEFDDDGQPTNVAAVVKALADAEPGLVGAQNGSPTNPDRQRGPGISAEALARMTPAEIEKAGITPAQMFEIAAKG
jgi:hypothetical protein